MARSGTPVNLRRATVSWGQTPSDGLPRIDAPREPVRYETDNYDPNRSCVVNKAAKTSAALCKTAMRPFKHVTPKYIRDRIKVFLYERRFPDHPWLTAAANSVLESWLKRSDVGLEFGAGRSTLWFGKRVHALVSIEHDREWCDHVLRNLQKSGMKNVDCRLVRMDREEEEGLESNYVRELSSFKPGTFDFVLVDGVYRDACAISCLKYIKQGGILILDNANWYLPSYSFAPNSRSHQDGPASPLWGQFLECVNQWRCIWTTSGVTDTAIWVKTS